jgi:hypothetical protein
VSLDEAGGLKGCIIKIFMGNLSVLVIRIPVAMSRARTQGHLESSCTQHDNGCVETRVGLFELRHFVEYGAKAPK